MLSASATALLQLKTTEDLANWLGFAAYADLHPHLYPTPKYKSFSIRKKSGGIRPISAPRKRLLEMQRKLASAMLELDQSRESAHGFRRKRSVVTNAMQHSGPGKSFVFNIDLEDFFSNISYVRCRGVFRAAPFDLPFSVACVLAQICCFNGCLPQGAATSPVVSNFVCRGLDGALEQLAKRNRARYTRYADDMTFSFSVNGVTDLPPNVVSLVDGAPVPSNRLEDIIAGHGFAINYQKVRLRSRRQRMEVTGLTVNDFPNVTRTYVDEIRGMLTAWRSHGLEAVQKTFLEREFGGQWRSGAKPKFYKHLRGRLLYLHNVKGPTDRVYTRLARRFNALASTNVPPLDCIPVSDTVLDASELSQAVYHVGCIDEKAMKFSEGSAFLLSSVGIVTCDHVVQRPNEGEDDPQGYFGPNGGTIVLKDNLLQDVCELVVVWSCEIADIAVLKPKAALPDNALYLRPTRLPVKPGMQVHLCGFPNHSAGKTLSKYDTSVVNTYASKTFRHYELAQNIRKGNSGGPVLDETYGVIGIAKEGSTQAGGNDAVVSITELFRLAETFADVPWKSPV